MSDVKLLQKDLSAATESTITIWKGLSKGVLIKGTVICPLCRLIKDTFRVSFHKGSARGACTLCPMKHAGLFHICVGIQHVYSTPDITNEEMKSLRITVLDSLQVLKDKIEDKTFYRSYVSEATKTYRKHRQTINNTYTKHAAKENKAARPKRIFKVSR